MAHSPRSHTPDITTSSMPMPMPSPANMEAPDAPSPRQQHREIAPFLKSLRRMLDSESAAILRWTDDGKAFEIHDVKALTRDVLHKHFKHAKYASFQRQLNYFNFRKWTKSKTEVCTFSNPHFQRDAPTLSWRILRKRSLSDLAAHKANKRVSVATPTSDDSDELSHHDGNSDGVDHDVVAALDWIDALFPSLEMLSRLGDADAAPPLRAHAPVRNTPMPPQSYERVAW